MNDVSLQEFIDTLGNAAVKYYPQYKILPSLCIAQAIQESNKADYKKGQLRLSGLAKECNNFFGMKWNSTCGTDRKAYKTKEWDKATQSYVEIIAYFRKYDTPEAGIKGYFDFLSYNRYKPLIGVTDYKKACELIKTCGWATSPTYTQSLIQKVQDLQLYKWDEMAIGDSATVKPKITLRKGMKDEQTGDVYVRSWQTFLNTIGFKCPINGIFDDETEQAVKDYQKYKGLVSDGIIGPKTWATLP